MEDKTVFSVETIGEIATTKTSSAEDVASDAAADERKTKRGGRGKNGRVVGRTEDASRGGDRRAVIDGTEGMTALLTPMARRRWETTDCPRARRERANPSWPRLARPYLFPP